MLPKLNGEFSQISNGNNLDIRLDPVQEIEQSIDASWKKDDILVPKQNSFAIEVGEFVMFIEAAIFVIDRAMRGGQPIEFGPSDLWRNDPPFFPMLQVSRNSQCTQGVESVISCVREIIKFIDFDDPRVFDTLTFIVKFRKEHWRILPFHDQQRVHKAAISDC